MRIFQNKINTRIRKLDNNIHNYFLLFKKKLSHILITRINMHTCVCLLGNVFKIYIYIAQLLVNYFLIVYCYLI